MTNIKTAFLKASSAIAGVLAAASMTGCVSIASIPGANVMPENQDPCMARTTRATGLAVIYHASVKDEFNQECGRNRIAAKTIEAGTVIEDPVARADTIAVGLAMARADNEDVSDAINKVANVHPEADEFRERITAYEDNIRRQGADAATAEGEARLAAEREALEAKIAALEEQNRRVNANFNRTTIELIVPSECPVSVYNAIKHEFEEAYSRGRNDHRVVVNNTDYSLQRMGYNASNVYQACADMPALIQGVKGGGAGVIPSIATSRDQHPTPLYRVAAFASVYPNVTPNYGKNFKNRIENAGIMIK